MSHLLNKKNTNFRYFYFFRKKSHRDRRYSIEYLTGTELNGTISKPSLFATTTVWVLIPERNILSYAVCSIRRPMGRLILNKSRQMDWSAEALYSSTSWARQEERRYSCEKTGQESRKGGKSGSERSGKERRRKRVGKQNAALKVDGVSCYVLLSTLGRSPTPASSLIQFGEKSSAKATKII